jgi:hypothetical protein
MADAMAVLLQTGRDLEFIGEDVFAQAMRITATSFFFSRGMREAALRPRGSGACKQNNNNAESADHVRFLHKRFNLIALRSPNGIGPH